MKCIKCSSCAFISFFQSAINSHKCLTSNNLRLKCPGCNNNCFTTKESLRIHLAADHGVNSNEIDMFISSASVADKSKQKIHIVDYQLLKNPEELQQKPKSKIFIKDVTLLRKPDLPANDIPIPPNIFDSLDLTTTDDDVCCFDDFLGPDDQIFNDDFDFDDTANLNDPTPEPINEVDDVVELVNTEIPSAKIFVRKNLCSESSETAIENASVDAPTSKIFVRSHESLTSQAVMTTNVTKPPSEASTTPDCIIVSNEVVSEIPQSKIFIRNIETLTKPNQEQSSNEYNQTQHVKTSESYFSTITTTDQLYTPTIYVRSYDSLISSTAAPVTENQLSHQRSIISIKNMNSLIEPNLMQPPLFNPSSLVFGQAQDLIIHMKPQQSQDDSLSSYRDSSVTPDTLPGSSNVSCAGNDDVIILDDGDHMFNIYNGGDASEEHNDDITSVLQQTMETPDVHHIEEVSLNPIQPFENPERNQTPNNKPVIEEIIPASINENDIAPMVRIPEYLTTDLCNDSSKDSIRETMKKKKMKIVKVIRIKKKASNNAKHPSCETQSNDINVDTKSGNVQIVFKCSFHECSQHFSSDKLLIYHKKCHVNSCEIMCPECNSNEFKNFNTLHTHLWRQHKIDMDLYSCKLCDFKTPILSRLTRFHEKIHSDERNFKCVYNDCTKCFKNSKQLKNHIQIHKKSNKTKPKMIMSTQDDPNKTLKCLNCNKGFSSDSGLYIHSLEHKTEDKKFKCDKCSYETNDHNSFRRHKSFHTRIKKYKCPECDYSCIQSNTYRNHLKRQHPEIVNTILHKCQQCNFTTINKSKFDGHLLKHNI